MIIFDLDGILANHEHRLHFIDPEIDQSCKGYVKNKTCTCPSAHTSDPWIHKNSGKKWKPNYEEFYKACDKDIPNKPIISILESFGEAQEYGSDTPWVDYDGIEIWTGRIESMRGKTEKWLDEHIDHYPSSHIVLKMRPDGDNSADWYLKEIWLDEHIAGGGKPIEIVFEDRSRVVEMWRRRGITCLQISNGNF